MSRKILLARSLQPQAQQIGKPSHVIELPRAESRNATPTNATVVKHSNELAEVLSRPGKRRRTMKPVPPKSYPCQACSQRFTVQSKFAELLRIHSGGLIPFAAVSLKCTKCNTAFRAAARS